MTFSVDACQCAYRSREHQYSITFKNTFNYIQPIAFGVSLLHFQFSIDDLVL